MEDGSSDIDPDIDGVREAVAAVERRLRIRRGLERATTTAGVALMAAVVVLALCKTGWVAWATFGEAGLGLLALPALAFASAWWRSYDEVVLAQRIDRTHGLHDRLSTALNLGDGDGSEAFREAQIADALEHLDRVDPARAVAFEWPQDLRFAGAFAAAFLLVALVQPPSQTHPLPDAPNFEHAPVMDESTIAMEKDQVREMKERLEEERDRRDDRDENTKELVDELDELLQQADDREISSREFLEKVDELKAEHFGEAGDDSADGSGADDPKTTSEQLREAAEKLKEEAGSSAEKMPEVEKALDALSQDEPDVDQAAKALEKLAEKAASGEEMSADQLEKLADMMRKFGENMDRDKLREMLEKHEKTVEKLSEKLRQQGDLSQGEQRRLDRAKKEADELRDQMDDEQTADKGGQSGDEGGQQLERLRRQAEKTADRAEEAAERKRNKSGDGENSDDPDYRNQSGRASDKRKKKKKKQKRSGRRGGEKQGEGKRGEGKQGGGKQGGGKQGGGDDEDVRRMARKQLEELERSVRRSQPKESEQNGESQSGDDGEKMERYLRRARGKSGESDESSKKGGSKRRASKGDASKKKSGEASGDKGSRKKGNEGSGKPSDGQARKETDGNSNRAGDSAGSKELGEATSMKGEREEKRVRDQPSGEGPEKSKVIRAASEKGFADREYRKVYGDYSKVVEDVMKREDVPPGYRYYVKRYFELIKPRE